MFKQESRANFGLIPIYLNIYIYIYIYIYIHHLLDQVRTLSEPCREGRRAATQSFASAEGHWDPVGPKSANSPFRWPRSSGQGYHRPMDHCGGKMISRVYQFGVMNSSEPLESLHETYPIPRTGVSSKNNAVPSGKTIRRLCTSSESVPMCNLNLC